MSDVSTDAPVDQHLADENLADDAHENDPRTRPSLGPVIALGLAAAILVGALGVAIIGGDDVSPVALTVDGTRTTSATLDQQLDGFASGTYFKKSLALSPPAGEGSLNAVGTSYWLALQIQATLAERLLDRQGTPLTAAQVKDTAKELQSQGVTAGMSSEAAEQLARLQASTSALAPKFDSEAAYRAAMRREARRTTISLDPKYGRWNADKLKFCVPLGCKVYGLSVVPPAQSSNAG